MKEKIYKGSSKSLYQSDEEYALILSFEDTLRIGKTLTLISGKGAINNSISAYLMQKLDMIGIENHLIEKMNMKQQLVQFVDVYPVQVYVSTIACGRYVQEFGMEDGLVFDTPIIDFKLKNKDLNYPIINESQILNFGWMTKRELQEVKDKSLRIHDFLAGLFASINIRMVEVKLEFGRVFNGEEFISMLIDEISPDTCRLWDMDSNEKLCYEIAQDNIEHVILAYQEVMQRLKIKNY